MLLTAGGEQHDPWPVARTFTKRRLDRVGHDVDQAIVQCLDIQDRLCGVAALEEGPSAPAKSIDRPSEISKGVARPSGEFALIVSQDNVQMI